jgi:hypothetical protein
MSVALAAVAATLAVMAAAAPQTPAAATAAARPPATISCANKAWTYAIPRKRPSRCIVFTDNRPDHADEFDLRGIHWHHWGARHATASATSVYCCMGGTIRRHVKLLAARRADKCGHRAYTRLRVTFRDGTRAHLRPPACRRRLDSGL